MCSEFFIKFYRVLEILNGERGNIKVLDYKVAKKAKMFCLNFIK